MELTDQQYKELEPFEHYLNTAYYHDYVRSMPFSDAVKLKDIYVALGYATPNLTCGKCVLKVCKTLGKLYSSKKETYEKEQNK